MKKIVSILLCCFMLFSAAGVFAAESTPLLENGSFEIHTDAVPACWTAPVGTWGEDIEISNTATDGKASLRLFGNSKNAYVKQEIEGLRHGAKYTLSFDILREYGTGISSRIEFSYIEGESRQYMGTHAQVSEWGETESGKWRRQAVSFTVPPNAEKTIITFRKEGSASVFFDNVTLSGGEESGAIEIEAPATAWAPGEIENSENLIQNNGFEETEEGFAKGWNRFSEENVSLNTEKEFVRSGEHSVKISAQDTKMPWARFEIAENIVPGAQVTFTCWAYSPTSAGRVGFKTEDYVLNYDHLVGTGSGGSKLSDIKQEDGWVQLTGTERIPNNTDTVWLYVRMYGQGEVYIDDVEYKVTKGPEAFNTFLTDEVFYYSDWEGNGKATVTANVTFYPEFIGDPLHFAVLDKELMLYEEIIPMNEEGKVTFEYPLTLLRETMKEYTIRCSLYDENDSFIARAQETVYKVDRPGYITEDGYYVENGERFDPIYMYHCTPDDEERLIKAKEIGVNLLQGYPVQEQLDLLAKLDMKAFIVLYSGGSSGQSAGHASRIAQTIAAVNKYKDHPAVFAWALMDEPTSKAWPDLKKAYIEIRKLDPNHPVFITMNGNFDATSRFTDIVSCDAYPYGFFPFTTKDYDTIDEVVGVNENRKPVYNVLQAFDMRDSFPTAQELRNMIYQSFWAGGKGIGYFSWSGITKDAEGKNVPLYKTHLWEPLASFYNLEYEEVLEHFVYKELPTFNEVRTEEYWYRSWVKDGRLSLVILNRKDKESVDAEIKLMSADGSVQIGDFKANVINGSNAVPFEGTDGTFSVKLEPGQAILYSITVEEDLSGIVSSGFSDMHAHGWAEKAVKALHERDVLYSNGHTFTPGETVTRADFAYMLMRALEIPQGEAESFSDVKVTDYFAEEVQSGRAHGLLHGMGENTFGAYEPISRQDLMTMCLRAAQYAGKLQDVQAGDLSVFSDSVAIAEYAMDAVSMMVGAGVIEGNADGTINPLGNATRAEAAVMIARLLDLA